VRLGLLVAGSRGGLVQIFVGEWLNKPPGESSGWWVLAHPSSDVRGCSPLVSAFGTPEHSPDDRAESAWRLLVDASEHRFHALSDSFDEGGDFVARFGRYRFELLPSERRRLVAQRFDIFVE
jgi:hypothetical protein